MPESESAGLCRNACDAAPSASVFDLAAMLRSLDNDAHLAHALAQLFVAGCPGLMLRMRLALAAGDITALGRAAHEIKGALGNFHAGRAVAAAAALEAAAGGDDFTRAARLFPSLEAEIDRLMPELESLQDALPAA